MNIILICSMLFGTALAFPIDDGVEYYVESRITGGDIAIPNQFPYQVGMEMEKNRNGKRVFTWCGGSLLSETVVVTAAHCLNQALNAIVMFGAHNRYAPEEPGRIMIDITPENMIVHETYNRISSENDIALIILPRKVPLSKIIQTINLPRLSQKSNKFENTMALISGWGRKGDGPQDSGVRELRFVLRRILPDENCKHIYPMYKSYNQVCVDGAEQKSACSGDSGGPLAITEANGSKTLIGLTSYGRANGCQKNFPVAYTRITAFLNWIAEHSGLEIRQ
uniref:Venom polypeptide n=1 Tax=Dolopus genitalis TaxID=2488630 RepID=A0A3G5BIH4_DOLGE|nr:venom polypeptide [Dolopus genitalis]